MNYRIRDYRLRELLDTVYRQVEHGSYAEPLASGLATSNPNSAQVFSNLLFGNLLPVVAAMKHPGFQEEKEWRLISPVTDANVKHRPGAQTIIPYLTFPLPVDTDGQMDIRETVIGPTGVAEETSCQAVRSLYLAWGYADIPNRVLPGIQPSRIPFRSW